MTQKINTSFYYTCTESAKQSRGRQGRNIGGACKTKSSVRPTTISGRAASRSRRDLERPRDLGGGRVSRPETTRSLARQVASVLPERQLCNQWSNHGALNSQITLNRNETPPGVHYRCDRASLWRIL